MSERRDFFVQWDGLWALPSLWAAVRASSAEIGAQVAADAVLRDLVRRLTPAQAFDAQLVAGRFAAAQLLLSNDEYCRHLGEAQVDGLKRRLALARAERVLRLEQRVFILEQRIARLGSAPIPAVEDAVSDARHVVSTHADEAEQILGLAEDEIMALEERRAGEIESRLLEALRNEPDPVLARRWEETVRACLRAGHWQTAERWIQDGISAVAAAAHTARRPGWPGYDTHTALAWLKRRDTGAPRPPTFDREWGVADGDQVGEALVDALDAVHASAPVVVAQQVAALIAAIERALGVEGPPAPAMVTSACVPLGERMGTGWHGRLRGLRPPGVYAFSGSAYDDGVPFIVTTRLTSTDEDTPLRFETPLSIVYGPLPQDRPRDAVLELTPADVMRILGDAHDRRRNAVRMIVGKVPLRLALPTPAPHGAAPFLVGREDVVVTCRTSGQPVLATAAAGIGRTALARHLDNTGATEPWIVQDDLQCVPPESVHALLADLVAQHGKSGRVVATAPPDFVWMHTAALAGWRIERLSVLRWEAVYEMVLTLLDPLDVEFDGATTLDRFVYETGGHPGLVHALLWGVCQRLDSGARNGPAVISLDLLHASLVDPEYRREAKRLLLEFIDRYPALQVLLGALLVDRSGATWTGTAQLGDLLQWPELLGLRVSDGQARTALHRLHETGLIEPCGEDQWQLVPTGVGTLVLALVGDPDAYLEDAVSRCSKLPDGSLLHV